MDAVIADLGPRLFRFFRASFSAATADDLVQQTLLRLIEKVNEGRFNPILGSLRMFAFGIAHFVRLEAWRAEPAEFAEVEVSVDPRGVEALDVRRLRRAIRELSDVQRHIVTLMIDEDLTLVEISVILSLPENTVKSHVHRAKAALRTFLGEN